MCFGQNDGDDAAGLSVFVSGIVFPDNGIIPKMKATAGRADVCFKPVSDKASVFAVMLPGLV